MEDFSAVMECNGECVVTFEAAKLGNWIKRRVKFCIKMEEMEREEEHTPQVRTGHVKAEDSSTESINILKKMRLKAGLQLILNNFYWSAILEMIRDRMFWIVQKVGNWLLLMTIFLCMKQEIQLHVSGKIGCEDFRRVFPERENCIPRERNRFHEMFRNQPPPQADERIEVVEEHVFAPGDRDRSHFREDPEDEEVDEIEVAEQRLIRRVRERYADFRKEPERDEVDDERLGLIPRVFSQEFTPEPERDDEIEPEANQIEVMQVVSINRTRSLSSIDSNLQLPSKINTSTTAVDWYFRRHRLRKRGGK